MEIPTIILPDIKKIETVEIPIPTADVPYYKPMVVPPSDLRDQEEEPVKTVEEKPPEPPTLKIPFIKQPVPQPSAEVVVTAVTTAVTAVAATTLTQPLIENIRKRAEEYPSWEDQLDKIYWNGIDAWKADIKAIKDKYPKP